MHLGRSVGRQVAGWNFRNLKLVKQGRKVVFVEYGGIVVSSFRLKNGLGDMYACR